MTFPDSCNESAAEVEKNAEKTKANCQAARLGSLDRQAKPGKHSQHFHPYDHQRNSENCPEPV
jgi:hypothetical protein